MTAYRLHFPDAELPAVLRERFAAARRARLADPAEFRRELRNARRREHRASTAFDKAVWHGTPAQIARALDRLDHAEQVLYDLAAFQMGA